MKTRGVGIFLAEDGDRDRDKGGRGLEDFGINGECASEIECYLVVCLSASPVMTIVGHQDVEPYTHKPSIEFRYGYPSNG